MARARELLVPLALVLGATAGCAADSTGDLAAEDGTAPAEDGAAPSFSEAEADTVVAFTLSDYRFEGPTTVKGPKVLFTADNEGTEDHELEVLDANGEAVGEIEAFAPGAAAGPLAVTLEPGEYTLQCILETTGGQEHKALGMFAPLRVE